MRKVILIHGWDGSPEREWFPWIREKLEKGGYEVVCPNLPEANHPKLGPWLDMTEKEAGKIDENTIFVGHSLGCITALHFLAKRVSPDTKIAGAIFVAGFSGRIFEPQIAEFYDPDLDISAVAKKIGKKFVFYSDNDDYVSPETAHGFSRELNAEEIFIPDKGHFSEDDDVFEFPELLKIIFEMK